MNETRIYFTFKATAQDTLELMVLKKSKTILSYRNKQSEREMTYFNIIAVKGHDSYYGRMYLKNRFQMIQEGTSFKFSNIISKGENTFWAGSNTSVSYCAVVETTVDSATLCLPEEEPAEGIQKPLKDALVSPNKSTVTGKVAKVLN